MRMMTSTLKTLSTRHQSKMLHSYHDMPTYLLVVLPRIQGKTTDYFSYLPHVIPNDMSLNKFNNVSTLFRLLYFNFIANCGGAS